MGVRRGHWLAAGLLALLMAGTAASAETLRVGFLPSWGEGWQDAWLIYAAVAEQALDLGPHDFEFVDVAPPVTAAALAALAADVLVLCDPSGGNEIYSVEEAETIEGYLADAGAGVVGTFKFRHSFYLYDDAHLMPLFGLDGEHLTYGDFCSSGRYELLLPEHPLFAGLGAGPLQTQGLPCSQEIDLADWAGLLQPGSRIAARTDDGLAVAVVHEGLWRGVYVSSMPDYIGEGPGDLGLVYNALVWAAGRDPEPTVPAASPASLALLVGLLGRCLASRRRVDSRIPHQLSVAQREILVGPGHQMGARSKAPSPARPEAYYDIR